MIKKQPIDLASSRETYSILGIVRTIFQKSVIFGVVVLTFLLLLFGKTRYSLDHYFNPTIMDALSPTLELLSYPPQYISDMFETIEDIINIYDENKQLKEENLYLSQYYSLLKHVQAENIELRKLSNFVTELYPNFVTARVIIDSNGPFTKSLIVTVGTKHNVEKGAIVMNNYGLIGRVNEVSENTSRVLLITDLNSRIPILTSDSRERGILTGNNSDDLEINYLPHDSHVKEGELIFTSGDGKYIPAGILIGSVKHVDNTYVLVEPSVQWKRLEYVRISN